MKTPSCLSAIAVLASSPALAQQVPPATQPQPGPVAAATTDGVSTVGEDDATVVVTASRSPQPLAETGQSVSVLTASDIRARQSQTVSDLLRTLPGVTVTRSGGPGTVVGLSIRGAENDQNVVLIDGVKLNDPASTGGGFNFGTLLTGNIRRIEVVRGSQSVIWGSQAIGGVVNLLTASPTDRVAIDARGEYGWRDTGQIVGNVSGTLGPVAASVGAGWFRTDGISAFSEARGGRERDGYDQFGANAKLLVTITDALSIDLRGFHSDGRTQVDGFAPPSFAFGDTRDYNDTREWIGYAGINAALFDGRLKNRIAYAYTRVERTAVDPSAGDFVTFDSRGTNERVEYQGTLDLGRGIGAVFGAESEWSRFAATSFGGPLSRARARLSSVYAQATVAPVEGVSLTGGVRHDDHDRFGGATTFAASGTVSPNGGATRIRASYGEGFKAPSLYQLYGDYGNTTLAPERSTSWDAGVVQQLIDGRAEASVTYFHRDTTNQIDFRSCPTPLTGVCTGRPFGTYFNIARTRATGVEAALTLRPTNALTVTGQYSSIDSRNRATDLRLARRPGQSVSAVVDWQTPLGLALGTTIVHVGGSFEDAANRQPLEGYVLVDLRARLPITRSIELYGRVENLFDEAYETVRLYGTAGRAAYAGVRLSL